MLRFLPDSWLEALARPLILADPSSGVYFEQAAPDLRFALLLLALLAVLPVAAARRRLPAGFGRVMLSLVAMFAIWTVVIGNGRYFIAGLLLVGPLLVLSLLALPGTRAWRATALGLALVLQGALVFNHFSPGQWAMAHWTEKSPGLPLPPGAWQPEQPAVFLTISGISFSLLVPQFDPRSRWSNIAGQVDVLPGRWEYPALRRLLDSPYPKYVVLQTMPFRPTPGMQPDPAYAALIDRSLARVGLRVKEGDCPMVLSHLKMHPENESGGASAPLGFWFCPLEPRPGGVQLPEVAIPPVARQAADAMERRCPRWFPSNSSNERWEEGVASRHYPMSDMRIYIEPEGSVYLRYQRALNPTRVGATADVAAGRFELDCRTMPGRYKFPWESD